MNKIIYSILLFVLPIQVVFAEPKSDVTGAPLDRSTVFAGTSNVSAIIDWIEHY